MFRNHNNCDSNYKNIKLGVENILAVQLKKRRRIGIAKIRSN